jgi:hypothetical protein
LATKTRELPFSRGQRSRARGLNLLQPGIAASALLWIDQPKTLRGEIMHNTAGRLPRFSARLAVIFSYYC